MKSNLKTFFSFLFASFLFLSTLPATFAQTDSTGFAGDHFSLAGALSLFETAQSLEDFEKALNTEDNYVNNLDLNEDGAIDYIRVVDHVEKDIHAIVLQTPISATETQDIAVIELEKTGDEQAMLQIIGDVDVYGEQKIVEPFEMDEKTMGKGPSAELEMNRVIINVWAWPAVRFVYGPRYRPYVSPFGWRTYPRYWKPWRPYAWRVHHRHRVFRPHFRVVNTHRVVRAHRVYIPQRRTSTVVRTRTTVVRNRNGKVVGTKTKRTTTVRGKNGKVVARKTNTRKAVQTKKGRKVSKKKTKRVRKRRQ